MARSASKWAPVVKTPGPAPSAAACQEGPVTREAIEDIPAASGSHALGQLDGAVKCRRGLGATTGLHPREPESLQAGGELDPVTLIRGL